MPTVLRDGGFRVLIFLPPREHSPPHVHVRNSMGEAVIDLPVNGRSQLVRSVTGMRTREVAAAFWLVEEHAEYLLERWSEYHG